MTPLVGAVDRLFEAHLSVRDLDSSIAFYRDRLGLELAHRLPGGQAAFFWLGGRGRSMLGLWAAGTSPQHVTSHIAFAASLPDVLAAPAALTRAGITPLDFDGRPASEPVVLAWMPAAAVYFHDPDGHLLELAAMLDDDPRPDGGVARWSEWIKAGLPDGEPPHAASDVRDLQRRVLAISGSLRRASSNTALIEALAELAPAGATIEVYRELHDLPPFDPDLDPETLAPVRRFRAALTSCDALVICSPEYAHGVPGALKNALDWVVGTGELIDKPVALINASGRATHAHASLREILTTMSCRVIDDASPVVQLDGRSWTSADITANPEVSALVSNALAALLRAAAPE